ncbi:hypothetical protein PXH59_10215 [Xenorhabdus sp. SF857]|uniref:phage tail fiber protein n=1 Tax=Xenorhabdus bakwenae TaxID=3026967 RepID=UPI0025581451|nr:hypothetical protein [Xenorhabdus sp. SF857]WFQ81372.1 hypothetical protein PXH59_10215 [Xenorhabdus sp. SF857]
MYYSQGTASTVSGSAIVRGTGTKFISNINGVAPGQLMLIRSGSNNLIHLIQTVNSDTELVLADNATVTLNNAKYQIQTTLPDSVSDGVRHIVANTSYITQFLQNMDKWMSQNGVVDVTLPNGQTVSLQSIRALQEALEGKADKTEFQQSVRALQATMEGKLDKSRNGADIPNKVEFVNNLGLSGAMKVGDYGFGGIARLASDSDLNAKRLPTSIYRMGGGDGDNWWVGWGAGILLRYDENNVFHLWLSAQRTELQFIMQIGNTIRGCTLWGTTNTTIDNNGFLKKASPIIQIYPDGTFITNDESEGATVTKLGIGHYQISGVLGYNADGAWGVHGGISSPKNNNGLELIYIDDTVKKCGGIIIRTFHRQHPHLPERFQNRRIKDIVDGEKVYYADAEPCDIPEGCRLDVRVQMPEDSVWNVGQGEVNSEP